MQENTLYDVGLLIVQIGPPIFAQLTVYRTPMVQI